MIERLVIDRVNQAGAPLTVRLSVRCVLFSIALPAGELTISEWTKTEFVSGIGMRLRTGQLNDHAASAIVRAFDDMAGNFDKARQVLERKRLKAHMATFKQNRFNDHGDRWRAAIDERKN